MPLLNLANEILLLISSHLPPHDLISLHALNHRLHSLLTPTLTRLMLTRKDPLLLWAAQLGSTPLLTKLLTAGANPTYLGTSTDWPRKGTYIQRTAIHIAAEYGHADFVSLLLDNGADVNSYAQKTQHYCTTPLHLAAKRGHEGVVRVLLDRGADLGLKDKTGATALHFAVKGGYENLVRLLLEKGADPTAGLGTTPLQFARWAGRTEIEGLLLEAGAGSGGGTVEGKKAALEAS